MSNVPERSTGRPTPDELRARLDDREVAAGLEVLLRLLRDYAYELIERGELRLEDVVEQPEREGGR